jgi:hypothetical protein
MSFGLASAKLRNSWSTRSRCLGIAVSAFSIFRDRTAAAMSRCSQAGWTPAAGMDVPALAIVAFVLFAGLTRFVFANLARVGDAG